MTADRESIQNILLATDFSEYSDKAREYACILAQSLGASITLLHAIQPIYGLDPNDTELKDWYRNLEKQLEAKLEKELDYFRKREIPASGSLIFGTPWDVVISFAEEEEMDLIVVGSHGLRTGDGRPLLGTTSHKIAFASTVPVLIVKADESWQ